MEEVISLETIYIKYQGYSGVEYYRIIPQTENEVFQRWYILAYNCNAIGSNLRKKYLKLENLKIEKNACGDITYVDDRFSNFFPNDVLYYLITHKPLGHVKLLTKKEFDTIIEDYLNF